MGFNILTSVNRQSVPRSFMALKGSAIWQLGTKEKAAVVAARSPVAITPGLHTVLRLFTFWLSFLVLDASFFGLGTLG